MPDLKKMLTLEALSEALPSWLKRDTKPEYNADEIDSTLTTNQFVTASDKDNWNAKGTYSKPSGGIPKSDLSSIVQTSLEKADSALQSETDPTVPLWAKQPNKPSYTQDEVADGSTYKRVTQTEKDAWSGKQNALTTTQMQAVNSGINSTKVAQIETNKTNILSVQENTPSMSVSNSKTLTTSKGYCYLTDWTKNLLNANLDLCKNMNSDRTWNGNSTTYRGVTYTVDDTTHSITFDGTSSSSSTSRIHLSPVFETTKYSDYWAVGVNTSDAAVGFGFTYCQNPDGTTWLKDEIDQGVGTKVNTAYPYFRLTIKVEKGHTADNLSVQPMFMEGTTPHAYVPYDGYTITSSNSDGTETDSVFVGTETPSPVMLKTYDSSTLITSSGEIEVVIPNNTQAEAITNSDVITHENRNALVEIVDSGAKNCFPPANTIAITPGYGTSFSLTNDSITLSTNGNWINANRALAFPIKAGSYNFSFTVSDLTGSNDTSISLRANGTAQSGEIVKKSFTGNGDVNVDFIASTDMTLYVLFYVSGLTYTDTTSYTASDLMITSQSEYGISSNYEPYALGNQILTKLEAEDRSNILSVQDDVNVLNSDFISLPRTILSKSPISFVSNTGANLNDYAIYKSSQSELGKRTVNIFDKSNFVIDSVYPNQTTGVLENSTSGNTWSIIFELISSGSETYTISWNKDVMHSNKARIAVYSGNDYPSIGDTPETFIATATMSDDFRYATFTTSSPICYVVIMLYSGSGYDQSTVENYIYNGDFQIEAGSSYSDYEPYGYKMRVACGNVITPLYFYSQPDYGNALTYKDTSVPIPTLEENNTFLIMDYSGTSPLVYISYT